MQKNKLIIRLLTLLIIMSTVLQNFPILTYAKEEEYKTQSISNYKTDKEVLDARIDEDLSTDDQILIDVSVKKDYKDMILVFQKSLVLTENSLLPNDMEIDNEYKDSSLYGENYTSVRLKEIDKNEEVSEDKEENTLEEDTFDINEAEENEEVNEEVNEDREENTLEREDLEINDLEESEEISLAFDVHKKPEKGDLFVAISDNYVSVLEFVKEDESTDKNEESKNVPEEESPKDEEDIPELDPRGYASNRLEVGYVRFMVQDTSGQPIGLVSYELKREENNREISEKRGNANRINGEIALNNLKWNTAYKLYLTKVPAKYEKPDGTVAEFYFDREGIHFTKGSTGIVVQKTGEQDEQLTEGQYYGFIGSDNRLKISKEYDVTKGSDAYCFRADDSFPQFGKKAIYNEFIASPETLYEAAQNPRGTPQELYNSVRKVIYYCETHKEELLEDHDLNNREFWRGQSDKEKGYYQALQQAIWYYSNSLNSIRRYPQGSNLHYIMKRAVDHIIQESAKVPDEDMESVSIKIYKTDMKNTINSPLQSLIAFEIKKVSKTDISILKVTEDGKALKGAVFKLEKLEDEAFEPIYMGNNQIISEFIFEGLTAGKYCLTEIQAPEDYISLGESIDFEIKENSGVFSIILNSQNPKVSLENNNLTIKVMNEKYKITTITVNKKWFTVDGKEFQRQDGSIIYSLMQVSTTKDGKFQEKAYKSGETLTNQEHWTKTYPDLPLTGRNDDGEEVTYTYYVVENPIADYNISYSNSSGQESETPSGTAITSGTITMKNTEKMKFVLPETGGMGRTVIYVIGVFLLGISLVMIIDKRGILKKKIK